MDLTELRDTLDDIDSRIVELYEKRMEICAQVAEYKIETGKRVFDKEREQQKLKTVSELTHNEFNAHGIRDLFEQIMAVSRKLQYQKITEHNGGAKGRFHPGNPRFYVGKDLGVLLVSGQYHAAGGGEGQTDRDGSET